MDLPTILADKALLASLSREYELLKATNASINWEEWITARLKRAAARRVGNSSSINATIRQQHARTAQQLKPAARHANVSLRTPSKTAAHQPAGKSGFSSGRSSTADAGLQAAPQAHEPLVYWQAQDVTNTQHSQQAGMPTPSLIQLHSSNAAQQQVAYGLYAQALPGQLAPHSGPQPHWVAAARLGTALQGSRVVSTMHAAADGERRLAAAAAVARQQLDLGLEYALAGASCEQQLQPAAQEQLQQMVKLTQEVVEQNQLLQKAMKQQQAQLAQQQGMLTTVLKQAGKPAASGTTSTTAGEEPAEQQSAAPAAQQAPASAADVAEAAGSPDKLRDQIKDSWLVKSLLQQTCPNSSNRPGPSNATTAPDFIRIAGATKQRPKRPAIDQQKQPLLQQQNRAAGAVSTAEGAAQDRRKQLKAVLRQLLTDGAVESLPDGLAGLVEGLKGLQSSSAHLQAQDSKAGAQAQAASLVALLRQQQQQQQQQTGLTQLSKAQQLVLQRRKAQEEERQRQQEQGEQQEDASKPGWQSEVYVPPPSRMLRVKKGGVADVWNAPDSSEPGTARQPASKPGSSKPQPSRRKPGRKLAAGARAKAAGGRRSSSGGSAGSARSLANLLYGSRWRVDGGVRQQQEEDMAARHTCGESSRLARVEEATTQVLEAVTRLDQRVQQSQGPAPQHSSAGAGNDSADSLKLQDPAALASLLAALERVEQQEKNIQERWFGSSNSSGGDGSCGAQQDMRPAAAAVHCPSQAGSECRAQADIASSAPAPGHQQAAASDHADEQRPPVVPLHQQDDYQLQNAMQQREQEQQEQACVLDAAAMKSIKAGRQLFLHHQALLDGTLHDLGSNSQLGQGSARSGAGGRGTASRGRRGVLQPVQVVEAVADVLLEELLLQEAQDLDGFCDALCDQLVLDEFEEA